MEYIKNLQKLTRDILTKAGVNVDYFYCPLPVEILTDYKWKFEQSQYNDYVEVYDEEGFNLKRCFQDIYLDMGDGYDGIYDKHEDYIVIITTCLNDHVKVLTILDKSKQLK